MSTLSATPAEVSSQAGRDVLGFHTAPPGGDLLDQARRAATRLTGRHGVVRWCRRYPEVPGLPTVPVFVARGPKRVAGGRRPSFDIIGMGVSDDPDDAWLKAVVEAVERYCFALPHDATLVERRSYRQVAGSAVPLERFRSLTDAQLRSRPSVRFPGPDDAIDWAWAYSLTRKEFALVPAVFAYPTVGLGPPNNLTTSVHSTGVSCHVSVEAALLAGLLEVVERDAIMLHWLHRRPPRRITPSESPAGDLVALLQGHFTLDDFEFVLLDITTDTSIPTICCQAISANPRRPAAAFGAACRTEPVAAARKALFEVAQVLSGLDGLKCDATTVLAESAVRYIWDHARFYASASTAPIIEFLTSSEESVGLDAVGEAVPERLGVGGGLQSCVDRLAARGLEVLAVDLTPEDVARCGLRTVKVLVPGMIDINGDARFPNLGATRVRTAPSAMGWPDISEDRLNLAPCPMS
ncbi:MAG TPA: YcaO-like family protein [Acidimicrobiales bacterium]|nr:YcaO-like family protein [Acidimicrobiales bacterium]